MVIVNKLLLERKKNIMKRETEVCVEVNVTKIVKYVCIAGAVIVTAIFGELAFKDYIKSKN